MFNYNNLILLIGLAQGHVLYYIQYDKIKLICIMYIQQKKTSLYKKTNKKLAT